MSIRSFIGGICVLFLLFDFNSAGRIFFFAHVSISLDEFLLAGKELRFKIRYRHLHKIVLPWTDAYRAYLAKSTCCLEIINLFMWTVLTFMHIHIPGNVVWRSHEVKQGQLISNRDWSTSFSSTAVRRILYINMYHKLNLEVKYLTEQHLTGFENYKVSPLAKYFSS